jgi:uncharacterized membrane-anchored protein YitT (DUF2179 family)
MSDERAELTLLRLYLLGLQFAEVGITLLLWRWFAVPMGLPALGYWHLFGLNILFSLFSWRFLNHQQMNTEDYLRRRAEEHFTLCASALLFGWLASFAV